MAERHQERQEDANGRGLLKILGDLQESLAKLETGDDGEDSSINGEDSYNNNNRRTRNAQLTRRTVTIEDLEAILEQRKQETKDWKDKTKSLKENGKKRCQEAEAEIGRNYKACEKIKAKIAKSQASSESLKEKRTKLEQEDSIGKPLLEGVGIQDRNEKACCAEGKPCREFAKNATNTTELCSAWECPVLLAKIDDIFKNLEV